MIDTDTIYQLSLEEIQTCTNIISDALTKVYIPSLKLKYFDKIKHEAKSLRFRESKCYKKQPVQWTFNLNRS